MGASALVGLMGGGVIIRGLQTSGAGGHPLRISWAARQGFLTCMGDVETSWAFGAAVGA